MRACLISPGDINGRITVHFNAPETDSEGQTLQIIPSLFSPTLSLLLTESGKLSRAPQTEMTGLLSDLARPSVDV